MKYELETVKASAHGQWDHILPGVCGIDPNILDGRGHPCPNPNCPNGPGRDRFAVRDIRKGMLFCRHCNNSGSTTMDGIGAVVWLTGYTFVEAVEAVGDYLGLEPVDGRKGGQRREIPMIEQVAAQKRVSPHALLAYGGKHAERRDKTGKEWKVVRFPMYGEYRDGALLPTSHFDLSSTGDLRKGKTAYGKLPGLFLPSKTAENGTVVVWNPSPGQTVYLVEGVKDAAKLYELGYKASIGLPMAQLPKELYEAFRGMHVVMVPDRDLPGKRGSEKTAALLWGIAESIRFAHLPTPMKEKEGDDVRDVACQPNGPQKIHDAIKHAVRWQPESIGDFEHVTMFQAAIDWLETSSGGEEELISTGIPLLDNALGGGIAAGEIVVVGARPSHGKTAIANTAAVAHCMRGESCLFLSEEMNPTQLAKRWLSSICDGSLRKADRADLLGLVQSDFADMKRLLITPKLNTVDKVVAAMEKAQQQIGVTFAVLDYIQLVSSGGFGKRYDEVTAVSCKLSQAIKRTNIPTYVLAQLNREAEKRGYPLASDLKESGQLEQDADVILLLWYPSMLPDSDAPKHEFEIHVAKNRNRGLPRERKIRLDFDGQRMTFSDPSVRRALEAVEDGLF